MLDLGVRRAGGWLFWMHELLLDEERTSHGSDEILIGQLHELPDDIYDLSLETLDHDT